MEVRMSILVAVDGSHDAERERERLSPLLRFCTGERERESLRLRLRERGERERGERERLKGEY